VRAVQVHLYLELVGTSMVSSLSSVVQAVGRLIFWKIPARCQHCICMPSAFCCGGQIWGYRCRSHQEADSGMLSMSLSSVEKDCSTDHAQALAVSSLHPRSAHLYYFVDFKTLMPMHIDSRLARAFASRPTIPWAAMRAGTEPWVRVFSRRWAMRS
jgi:hypothetical protein